jgi:nucleotide-binding universal stress UspA family protein
MSYRSLLVQLGDDENNAARTELAARLAQRSRAHLMGLSATGHIPLTSAVGPGMLGLDAVTEVMAELDRQAELRAEHFRHRCRLLGSPSFDVLIEREEQSLALLRHAVFTDLVVLGQVDPRRADHAAAQSLLEIAVLQSPRPVLVVPYTSRMDRFGEDVLVAWNDSREAARAIGDAMPLLAQARRVHIRQFARHSDAADGRLERLEALRGWLRHHGVEAEVRVEVTEVDAGNALLSRAAELGSDLLVMGGYGHARWTERVLGGVTRTVLTSSPLPVVMSH